jgi:hypothetical protein
MREEDRSRTPLILGLVLLLVAGIGSTLAANISINGTNRIEFGQGSYTVQACQGWIQVSLSTGETIDGASPVTGLTFEGLDLHACAGNTLRVRIFGATDESGNTPQLDLFSGSNGPTNSVSLGIDNDPKIYLLDADGNPEIDSSNIPIENDGYLTLIQPDAISGNIVVNFNTPLANMESVTSLTIETGTTAT